MAGYSIEGLSCDESVTNMTEEMKRKIGDRNQYLHHIRQNVAFKINELCIKTHNLNFVLTYRI